MLATGPDKTSRRRSLCHRRRGRDSGRWRKMCGMTSCQGPRDPGFVAPEAFPFRLPFQAARLPDAWVAALLQGHKVLARPTRGSCATVRIHPSPAASLREHEIPDSSCEVLNFHRRGSHMPDTSRATWPHGVAGTQWWSVQCRWLPVTACQRPSDPAQCLSHETHLLADRHDQLRVDAMLLGT